MTFLETIKIKEGRFCNLSTHIDRMQKTAKAFFLKIPLLTDEQLDIPAIYRSGTVKCRIIYDSDIREITFTPYCPRSVSSLRLISCDSIDYDFKYTNRQSLTNLLEQRNGCDEILIVKNGLITDTSYSNVVFQSAGGFYTPSDYLLNGTKRQALLKQSIIRECAIRPENIQQYDRIFLINAMLDLEDNISLPIENIR